MSEQFVVMSIGCLCCNDPTGLMAVTDEAGARELGATLESEMTGWAYHSAHLVAFPLPEPPKPGRRCGSMSDDGYRCEDAPDHDLPHCAQGRSWMSSHHV